MNYRIARKVNSFEHLDIYRKGTLHKMSVRLRRHQDRLWRKGLQISKLLEAKKIEPAMILWAALRREIFLQNSQNFDISDSYEWGTTVLVRYGSTLHSDIAYYSDRWCRWRIAKVDAAWNAFLGAQFFTEENLQSDSDMELPPLEDIPSEECWGVRVWSSAPFVYNGPPPEDMTKEQALQSADWAYTYAHEHGACDATRAKACTDAATAFYYALRIDKCYREDTFAAAARELCYRTRYLELLPKDQKGEIS